MVFKCFIYLCVCSDVRMMDSVICMCCLLSSSSEEVIPGVLGGVCKTSLVDEATEDEIVKITIMNSSLHTMHT